MFDVAAILRSDFCPFPTMPTNKTDAFYQELGARIRNARILAGISQEILATHLDLTRASVINIEKGRHKPSLHQLLEIAGILMVHYSILIPTKDASVYKKVKQVRIDDSMVISDQIKIDKTTKSTVQKFLQSIHKY